MLAITDHNSGQNIQVLSKLAEKRGIHVFPGMEVETREEVHLIALFDQLNQMMSLQELVYDHLPPLQNDEERFGPQLLTDESDNFIDRVTRLLAVSTDLCVERVVETVEDLGGLVYPAHVDRQRNSILTQLGFLPPDIDFTAIEVSNRYLQNNEENPLLEGYPLLSAADVHHLEDLRGSMIFKIKEPTIDELKKAIRKEEGRSYYHNYGG